MENNYQKVRDYILDLEYSIEKEDENTGTLIISKEDEGIKNMVVACLDPIVILEQPLFTLKGDRPEVYKALLRKNTEIVHGAFAIDANGVVLFRDTLEVENLDLNEIQGSLNSLSLLLSEYCKELVEFAK